MGELGRRLLAAMVLLSLAGGGTGSEPAVRWASEKDLLADIAAGGPATAVDGEESGDLPLLRLCISRSWWTGARALISKAHDRGAAAGAGAVSAMQGEVTDILVSLKRDADDFAAYAGEAYRGQTKGLNEVHCALQWAQNSSAVFLGVKYATRWSAPGAIEVMDVTVNVTDSGFYLEGFGHHSSVRKRYVVSLDLHAGVAPTLSSWSSASVGRLTAILQKAKVGEKWTRLVKTKGKSKHQLTSWMDMEERWGEELERNTGTNKKVSPAPAVQSNKTKPEKKQASLLAPFWKEAKKRWRRLRKVLQNRQGAVAMGGIAVSCLGSLLAWRMRRSKRLDPLEELAHRRMAAAAAEARTMPAAEGSEARADPTEEVAEKD